MAIVHEGINYVFGQNISKEWEVLKTTQRRYCSNQHAWEPSIAAEVSAEGISITWLH
jgi:hypothetical protein